MKLHLPKLLRNSVLACITAVAGIATTTVGTATFTGGVVAFALSSQQAAAAEYTDPDLAATTFANGDVLNLGDGASVNAPLQMADGDSSITLNVTDGTVTWATSQGENRGVSTVNVATGATLDVTATEGQYCVFASKSGAEVSINLAAGAKMISNNLFGWDNQARGDALRTVNMGAGSEWTINGATEFYLNRTVINLSGGTIKLAAEDSVMWYERRENSINTTADATQMSVISGNGGIKAGNNGAESNGYIFNVVRGGFAIDATNTADLLMSAKLMNAGNAHGVQKTGNGVMEMTADNPFTHSFFVRAGEMKFTGAGNLGSSNLEVANGAILTLNTTAEFNSVINVMEGGTLQTAAGQQLTRNTNVYGTLAVTDTITLKGGTMTFSENAIIDLSGWEGGSEYQIFAVDGGTVTESKVQVVGVSGDGTWIVDSTGVLSLKPTVEWSSGSALDWAEGSQFDGGTAYANGMLVTFTADQGDVTATLGGAVSSPEVTVESGTNLILAGSGTLAAAEAIIEGDLTVKNTGNDFGSISLSGDSTLVIATGGETTMDGSVGTTNITGGTIAIDGNTTLVAAGNGITNKTITIEEGSTLKASGERCVNSNILVKGTLDLAGGDVVDWNTGNYHALTVEGGTITLGANRQSFAAKNQIVLNNGTITGEGDQHGALDFFENGGLITSSGESTINAPIRLRNANQTTTVNVVDGTLTLSTCCNKGGGASGNLNKTGAGVLAVTGALSSNGTVFVSAGTLKMQDGSSATSTVNLAGGSLVSAGTVTMGNLTGSGDVTVETAGALTVANASGAFNKLGAGALTITTVTGDSFGMNYEGSLTIGEMNLNENALLTYGNVAGGNLFKIESLSSKVVVDVLALQSDLATGIDLGIASTISQDNISILGLLAGEYTLTDKDGYWQLTSAAKLHSDWDLNWGSELSGAPAELTEAVITDFNSDGKGLAETGYLVEGRVAVVLVDNGIADVSGGPDTPRAIVGGAYDAPGTNGSNLTIEDGVWIQAVGGRYGAVVGGNMSGNWSNGVPSKIETDSHIVINKNELATELFIRDVVGGNFGDQANANMENAAQFTGDTYVSVYTDSVAAAVVGGSITFHGGCSVLTGDTNVYVYTALAKNDGNVYRKELKAVVGGMMAGDDNTNKHTLTGNSSVLVDLTGDTTTAVFDKILVGGNVTRNTQSVHNGVSSLVIKGIKADASSTVFNQRVVGGTYAQGGTSTSLGAKLDITGGTYKQYVVGGVLQISSSTSTIGDTVVSIKDATAEQWVTGGTFLNSSSATATQGDVDMTLTDSTFAKVVTGGIFIGGFGTTVTLGDVNITLDGVTLTEDLYGGVYHYADSNAACTSTVGDVSINLTGDGTVSGHIWAAGATRHNTANSTVASTTVNVDSTVTIADGSSISGGFKVNTGTTPNMVVTGDRTLVFNGNQDRSGVSFADFDKITVKDTAKAAIGALTTTGAVTKTGAGTLTLAGGTYKLSGGLTVAEGMLGAQGEAVLGGALTLNDGTGLDLTSGTLALNGDLTLGTGLVLTTGTLLDGDNTLLTGITSSAITETVAANTIFSSINGLHSFQDYTLRVEDGKLVLTTFEAKNVVWDEANSIWAQGAKFGSAEGDTFKNKYTATFGPLTGSSEEVTIDGPLTAQEIHVTAGAGKEYSFVAGANGTVSTETLAVGAGTAKFANNTLQLGDLAQVSIAEGGTLDLTGYGSNTMRNTFNTLLGKVSGDGTLKLAGSATIGDDAEIRLATTGDVTTGNNYAFTNSIAIHGGGSSNSHTLTIDDSFDVEGEIRAESFATIKVQDGGSLSASTISLGHATAGNPGYLVIEGGTVTASAITNGASTADTDGLNTITMSGGTLELTGTAGVASNIAATMTGGTLKAGDNSWGISGATIGGVTIETGSGVITLTDATLTSTIDNSAGKLALGGAIDITSAGYVTTETPSEYSVGSNEGYVRVNTNYVVANTAADTNLSIVDGTTWTVDGSAANVSYANGVVTVAGTDWSTDYYVRTVKTLSGIAKTNGEGEALATIVLAGGGLNMNEALGEGVTIRIEKEGQSVVDIGSGQTLAAGQVTGTDASHVLKLHGNGTYALADGSTTLGNAVLGEWAGTVKVTNAYQNDGKMDIDAKLNPLADADSTVEVTNVKGYLDTGKALTANVRLVNAADDTAAITITNGNSDATAGARKASIQGTVSGNGDIAFETWNGINGKYVTYEFTGEISGWNGSFINKSTESYSGTANVVIAGDTEINASILNDANRYEGSKLYLTIGGENDVTMNGAVDVDKLTVSQNTSFTNTVAVADLVNTASASFTSDLALSTLDNTGSITATGKSISVIGATTGAGSITAGALTLQAASNTVGDLTLTGALTLGTADAASTLNAGVLNIGGDVVVNKLTAGLITSTGLAGGSSLNLAITEEVLLDYMLTNVTNTLALGQIDGVTLDQLSLNGIGSSIETGDGQYTYTLSVDGGSITLNRTINGQEWEGTDGDNVWGVDGNWSAGTTPGEDDSVKFTGNGSSRVTIAGGVQIGNVTIDIEEGTDTYEYEFLAPADGSSAGSLAITKNMSVNAGTLTIGVSTIVEGRSEVLEGSTLNVMSGDLTSKDGFTNGGTLNISAPAGDTQSAVIVAQGDMVNTGTIMNGGVLGLGYGVQNASDSPNLYNSGTVFNAGTLVADGNLNNTGILYHAGMMQALGNASNTGANAELSIFGGLTVIAGVLDNDAVLTVNDGMVSAGSVDNSGTMNVGGGELTIGAEGAGSEVTSVNNSGALAVTGGSVLINGSVTNDGADTPADMSISGEGTSVNITGALTNADSVIVSDGAGLSADSAANTGSIEVTGSTLVLGDATTAADVTTLDNDGNLTVSGSEAIIYGSVDNDGSLTVDDSTMSITGDLNNSNGTITIGSDTATGTLEVGGDLTGTGGTDKLVVNSGSTLDVGGDLTALEDVELDFDGTVIVGGNVDIDSLVNNGVFKTTNTADEAEVKIGELSGSGELNVAGGKLLVGSQVDFTGILTGDGELEITGDNGFTLLTKQDTITDTALATDVTASELTITEAANGSILSDVKTDSIIIDKLDTQLGSEHLTVNSLTSKTDGEVIDIMIGDLAVDELIAKRGAEYDLIALGGAAPDMNLVNNDDVTTADMQKLLANGLNIDLLPGEVNPGVMTLAADSMVQLGVRELEIGEATWTVGDSTTGAGLIVLNDSGELKNADILDYVRKVEVSGDATIDLTNVDTAADNPVQINGLSDSETGTGNLTVQGTKDDYVAINNTVIENAEYPEDSAYVADYTGKLILKDVNADLALEDVTVDATTADTTITGSIEGGSLTVYQNSTAQVGEAGLELTDTTLNVVIEKDFIKLDQETLAALEGSIADLGGEVEADWVDVEIGTLDADGKLVESLGYNKYFDLDTLRIESDGVVLADRNTSYYSDSLTTAETSKNGAAGLTLADAALLNLNPQGDAVTGDLAAVLDQLDRMVAAGDTKGADELGANLAGASTAVLGMAAMGDVDRQLRAIRNRTTTMGVDQTVVNHDMPYFNAWINAEGDQREMKDDGTLGGYKYNSWGGTVGFDVDIEPTFTAGLALTAMYGDLDVTGADKATGNMDTYYVSAFARYCASAWTHTFVATAGMGDISLDRTVNGTTIEGETNSTSFGLMYEVGRVFALDEDATACIQPVFNVAWRHASVDGYTEKGSDAALEVGEQTLNTVTFGLGARLQAVVGESMYNRTSIFECRLLAKADVGDRESAADVALAGGEAEVKSAETGAFGLEAGAGLTIPLGDEGSSIFMDASVELRADYTNVNGTVGYRINF